MPIQTQNVNELEKILKNYTTYFIVFDIVFFLMLFICIILLINFLKSKKNLQDTDEYIRFVIQGQEEERERIARELHDTVAQNIKYCKNICEKENSDHKLSKLSELLSKSLVEIRSLSYNLSPPDITKNDFFFCIRNLCEEFIGLEKIPIRLSILESTEASFLSKNEILNLYRIIQESLTNIIKHADAEEAVLMIRNENKHEEKGLYIFISDDGKGFDIEKTDRRRHYGIEGMKKRASLIGATFTIISNIEEGTQICIFKSSKTSTNTI